MAELLNKKHQEGDEADDILFLQISSMKISNDWPN